ncbi:MAG: LAGLIDADG family homing endonuclease [Candidatus Hodarchaeota archaeon]
MPELGPFAEKIFKRTYAAHPEETWEECARRVADFVAGEDHKELADEFFEAIRTRKFMPGGRYLAQAGKEVCQTTNCFLLNVEDSREGWSKLLYKHMMALSTGGGVGTYYGGVRASGATIKRFGGIASGPISLMCMVNEVARHVLAGGKRRSACWAGLPWNHKDIHDFIVVKNWPTAIKALKEQNFNYPAPLDMTNISVCLDDEFFKRINKDKEVWDLYYKICKNMCKTGEPAFSVNVGKNKKEVLRNPCCLRGNTQLLTPTGMIQIKNSKVGDTIWTGSTWTKIIKKWNQGIRDVYKYETPAGIFEGTTDHKIIEKNRKIIVDNAKFIDVVVGPEQSKLTLSPQDIMDGLVLGDGYTDKEYNKILLCLSKKDEDYFTSEIKDLILTRRHKTRRTWNVKTTLNPTEVPYTFKRSVPDRFFFGNSQKKAGFLRGLFTANGSFGSTQVTLKQTSEILIRQVQKMLSSLGIKSTVSISNHGKYVKHHNGIYYNRKSYTLSISGHKNRFFNLIGFIQNYKHKSFIVGNRVDRYCKIKSKTYVGQEDVYDIMVEDKSHSFWANGLLVSNCEVTSDTDSDSCNLASINLPRIKNIDELKQITRLAVRFLYLGTYRSWLPHEDFKVVREQNRRIGLGIMGLHEWCIRHNERYEPNGELGKWLSCWESISNDEATKFSKKMKGPRPIAVRAIAPTGTIGILAETTTGIEPVYCVAYKRSYLGLGGQWMHEYVIDPTVKKLLDERIISSPNEIEDSIKLATNVERRIQMQAFVQSFVDQGISSTINLPEWGEPGNNNAAQFARTLLEYLPKLRGITVYPDGARPGQPITPVKWSTAMKYQPEAKEDEERCTGGICGI